MNKNPLITAGSITGVTLAAAAVIGANFGLIDAAAGSSDFSESTLSVAETQSQPTVYQVELAGMVTVNETADGLYFGSISANPGWTWVPESEGAELVGHFANGDEVIEINVMPGMDGLNASLNAVSPAGDSTVIDPNLDAVSPEAVRSSDSAFRALTPAAPVPPVVTAPPATTVPPTTVAPAAPAPIPSTPTTESGGSAAHAEGDSDRYEDDDRDDNSYDDNSYDDDSHDDKGSDDHEGRDDDD